MIIRRLGAGAMSRSPTRSIKQKRQWRMKRVRPCTGYPGTTLETHGGTANFVLPNSSVESSEAADVLRSHKISRRQRLAPNTLLKTMHKSAFPHPHPTFVTSPRHHLRSATPSHPLLPPPRPLRP